MSLAELRDGLDSRSAQRFDACLEAAQHAGPDGERALVDALDRVPRARRSQVVEALRHATGAVPGTDRVLERIVRTAAGLGSHELRAVAMGALVARTEDAAAPVLVDVLRDDPHGEMKGYALRYLAAVGVSDAVPEALRRLHAQLRRPSRDVEGRITALAYLGQHVATATEQMAVVVRSVRGHWASVHPVFERSWVAARWPDLPPDGPPPVDVQAPEPEPLRRWARSTMHLPADASR